MEFVFPMNFEGSYPKLISNSKKDLLVSRDEKGWVCLYKVIPIESYRVKF